MDEKNVLEKRNKIKNMRQAFVDYNKVKEVLKSCNNEDQLKVGVKMANLLDRKYNEEIPQQYWDTLTNIIGLMRMKCGIEKEPLEEISKSKLVKYKVKFSKREDRTQTFPKVTNTTPTQRKYFNMVGFRNPMSLEKFGW